MKLIRTKLLMLVNGLLTLMSLIMLFFGLCNQMNRANDFLADNQSIVLANHTDALIFWAVMAVIIFGIIFFASWIKSRQLSHHLAHHK